MHNKKLIISIFVFSILMFFTPTIKTQTRILEKQISIQEKKIFKLQNNIHEAQLDFYYLSSPQIIEKNIEEFSDNSYLTMDFSKIYLSFSHFIKEKTKFSKIYEK